MKNLNIVSRISIVECIKEKYQNITYLSNGFFLEGESKPIILYWVNFTSCDVINRNSDIVKCVKYAKKNDINIIRFIHVSEESAEVYSGYDTTNLIPMLVYYSELQKINPVQKPVKGEHTHTKKCYTSCSYLVQSEMDKNILL